MQRESGGRRSKSTDAKTTVELFWLIWLQVLRGLILFLQFQGGISSETAHPMDCRRVPFTDTRIAVRAGLRAIQERRRKGQPKSANRKGLKNRLYFEKAVGCACAHVNQWPATLSCHDRRLEGGLPFGMALLCLREFHDVGCCVQQRDELTNARQRDGVLEAALPTLGGHQANISARVGVNFT
jgi:hypothetical protein